MRLHQSISLSHSWMILNLSTSSFSSATRMSRSFTWSHRTQLLSLLSSSTSTRLRHSLQPETCQLYSPMLPGGCSYTRGVLATVTLDSAPAESELPLIGTSRFPLGGGAWGLLSLSVLLLPCRCGFATGERVPRREPLLQSPSISVPLYWAQYFRCIITSAESRPSAVYFIFVSPSCRKVSSQNKFSTRSVSAGITVTPLHELPFYVILP